VVAIATDQGKHTILLVYLRLNIKVDSGNDYVGEDVERADAVQDIRVIEGHLLGDLHKPPIMRISCRSGDPSGGVSPTR
jgi:hypothetical protein